MSRAPARSAAGCRVAVLVALLVTPGVQPSRAVAVPAGRTASTGEFLLPLDCDSLAICFRDGMALDTAQEQEVRRVLAEARRQREALRADTFQRLRAVLNSSQAGMLEARRAALLAGEAERLGARAECLQRQARPPPRHP